MTINLDPRKTLYGFSDFDYVNGQHHPHGLVGKFWRVNDPKTIRIGDCFLKDRLKKGDLFFCKSHSGDCFQTYVYVEVSGNSLYFYTQWSFGSYGIGDSVEEKFDWLRPEDLHKALTWRLKSDSTRLCIKQPA